MESHGCYSTLARFLAQRNTLRDEPFSLLDIGCSGGISGIWRSFEPALNVLAVDPLIQECNRLQSLEANPNIEYFPAFIGLPAQHELPSQRGVEPPTQRNPWSRLTACTATELMRANTPPSESLTVLNAWHRDQDHASAHTTIDELVRTKGLTNVDFIKIDIDGLDLDALASAEHTIKNSSVLGIAAEVNFYGSASSAEHTFHNTDRVLRAWGFDLFDLSIRRYSVSALPQPFQLEIPAQTVRGRPFQGDAIYLRDPCAWQYCPDIAVDLSPSKLIKLAALFALFGLPDHASELILNKKSDLVSLVNPGELLDLLAREVDPFFKDYHDYVAAFRRDPRSFYPSRLKNIRI